MSRHDIPSELRCPAVSSDTEAGHPCQKPLYRSTSGEVWEHAGGHVFTSDATVDRLGTWHYDAGLLLAGQAVEMHSPDECPGREGCSVARATGVGV